MQSSGLSLPCIRRVADSDRPSEVIVGLELGVTAFETEKLEIVAIFAKNQCYIYKSWRYPMSERGIQCLIEVVNSDVDTEKDDCIHIRGLLETCAEGLTVLNLVLQ